MSHVYLLSLSSLLSLLYNITVLTELVILLMYFCYSFCQSFDNETLEGAVLLPPTASQTILIWGLTRNGMEMVQFINFYGLL